MKAPNDLKNTLSKLHAKFSLKYPKKCNNTTTIRLKQKTLPVRRKVPKQQKPKLTGGG